MQLNSAVPPSTGVFQNTGLSSSSLSGPQQQQANLQQQQAGLQQQQQQIALQQQQQQAALHQQQQEEKDRSRSSRVDTLLWGGRVFERLYQNVILPFSQICEKTSVAELREKLQQLQAASIPTPPMDDGESREGPTFRRTDTASSSLSSDEAAAAEEELEEVQQQLQQLLVLERRTFAAVMIHADAFLHLLHVPERQQSLTGAQLLLFAQRCYPGWVHLAADIDAFSLQHNYDQRMCFALLYDAVDMLTSPSSFSSLSSSGLSLPASRQLNFAVTGAPVAVAATTFLTAASAAAATTATATAATAAAAAPTVAAGGTGAGGEAVGRFDEANRGSSGREKMKEQQRQYKTSEEERRNGVAWDPQLILYALQREQQFKLRCLLQLALYLYSDHTIGVLGNVDQQSNRVAVLIFSELSRRGFVLHLIDTIGSVMSNIVCPPYASGTTPQAAFPLSLLQAAAAAGEAEAATAREAAEVWRRVISNSYRSSSAAAAAAMTAQLHQVRLLEGCVKLLHVYLARFQVSVHEVDALLQLIPHVLTPQAALSSSRLGAAADNLNATGREERSAEEASGRSGVSSRRIVTAHDYDAKLQAAAAAATAAAEAAHPFTAPGDSLQQQQQQIAAATRGSVGWGERGVGGLGELWPIADPASSLPGTSIFTIEVAVAATSRCCFNGVSLTMQIAELLLLALHPKLLRWSVHAGKAAAAPGAAATATEAGGAGLPGGEGKTKEEELRNMEDADYPVLTELNCLSSVKDIGDIRKQQLEAAVTAEEEVPEEVPWDAGLFYQRLIQKQQSVEGAFWRDTGGVDSLLRFVVCGVYTADEQLAWSALQAAPIFPMLYLLFLSHRRSAADAFGLLSRQLLHEILWLAFAGVHDTAAAAAPARSSSNGAAESFLLRGDMQQDGEERCRSEPQTGSSSSTVTTSTTSLWRQLVQTQVAAACHEYIAFTLGRGGEGEDSLREGRSSSSSQSPSPAGRRLSVSVQQRSRYRWLSPAAAAGRHSSQAYDYKSTGRDAAANRIAAAVYGEGRGRTTNQSSSSCGASLLQQALYLMNAVCQGYPAACSQYTGILMYCIECFAALFAVYPQVSAAAVPASSLFIFAPTFPSAADWYSLDYNAAAVAPDVSVVGVASIERDQRSFFSSQRREAAASRPTFDSTALQQPHMLQQQSELPCLSSSNIGYQTGGGAVSFPFAASDGLLPSLERSTCLSPVQQQQQRIAAATPQQVMRAAAQALGLNVDVQPELLLLLVEFAATLSSLGGPLVARQVASCFGGDARAAAAEQQQQQEQSFFSGRRRGSSSTAAGVRRPGIDLARLLLLLVKQVESAVTGQYTALPSQCAFVAADYVASLRAAADEAAIAKSTPASSNLFHSSSSLLRTYFRTRRQVLRTGTTAAEAEAAAAAGAVAGAAVDAEIEEAATATQAAATAAAAACRGACLSSEGSVCLTQLMEGSGLYPQRLLRAVEVALHLAAALSNSFLLFVLPLPFPGLPEKLHFCNDRTEGVPGVRTLETSWGVPPSGESTEAERRLLGSGTLFGPADFPHASFFSNSPTFSPAAGAYLPGAAAAAALPAAAAVSPRLLRPATAWDGSWPPPPWLTHAPLISPAGPAASMLLLQQQQQQQQRSVSSHAHLLDVLYALLHLRCSNEKINLARVKASCLFALSGNLVRNPATALAVLLQLSRLVETLRSDIQAARRRDVQLLQEQQQQQRHERQQYQQQQQQPQRGLPPQKQQRWSVPELQFIQTETYRAAEVDGGQLLISIASCAAYNLQLVGLRRRFDASLVSFWTRSSAAASARDIPVVSTAAVAQQPGSVGGQQQPPRGASAAAAGSAADVASSSSFCLLDREDSSSRTHRNMSWLSSYASAGSAAAAAHMSEAVARDLYRLAVFLMDLFLQVFGQQQQQMEEVWQWIPQGRYWRLAALLLRCFRLLLRGPLPRVGCSHVDAAAREPYRGRRSASAAATSFLMHSFLSFESTAFDTLLKLTCFPFSVQQLHLPSAVALTLTGATAGSAAGGSKEAASFTPAAAGVTGGEFLEGTERLFRDPFLGAEGSSSGIWKRQVPGGAASAGVREEEREAASDLRRLAATAAAIGHRRTAAGSAEAAVNHGDFCEQVTAIGLDIIRILFQRDALYIHFSRRGETRYLQSSWCKADRNKPAVGVTGRGAAFAAAGDPSAAGVAGSSAGEDWPEDRSSSSSRDMTSMMYYPFFNECGLRQGAAASATSSGSSRRVGWRGLADVAAARGAAAASGAYRQNGGSSTGLRLPISLEGFGDEAGLFVLEREAAAGAAAAGSLCYVHEQLARRGASLVEALRCSQAVAAAATAAATAASTAAAAPGATAATVQAATAAAAEAAARGVLTSTQQLLYPFVQRRSYVAAGEPGRRFPSFAVPPYSMFVLSHLLSSSSTVQKSCFYVLQQLSLRDPTGLATLLIDYPAALRTLQTSVAAALLLRSSNCLGASGESFAAQVAAEQQQKDEAFEVLYWRSSSSSSGPATVGAASTAAGAARLTADDFAAAARGLQKRSFGSTFRTTGEPESLRMPTDEALADPFYSPLLSRYFLEQPSLSQRQRLRRLLLMQRYEELLVCRYALKQRQAWLQEPSQQQSPERQQQALERQQQEDLRKKSEQGDDVVCVEVGVSGFLIAAQRHGEAAAAKQQEEEALREGMLLLQRDAGEGRHLFSDDETAAAAGERRSGEEKKIQAASRLLTLTEDRLLQLYPEAPAAAARAAAATAAAACQQLLVLAAGGAVPAAVEEAVAAAANAVATAEAAAATEAAATAASKFEAAAAAGLADSQMFSVSGGSVFPATDGRTVAAAVACEEENSRGGGEEEEGEAEAERLFTSPTQHMFYSECRVADQTPFSSFCGDIGDDAAAAQAIAAAAADTWTLLGSGTAFSCSTALPFHRLIDDRWQQVEDAIVEATDLAAWQALRLHEKLAIITAAAHPKQVLSSSLLSCCSSFRTAAYPGLFRPSSPAAAAAAPRGAGCDFLGAPFAEWTSTPHAGREGEGEGNQKGTGFSGAAAIQPAASGTWMWHGGDVEETTEAGTRLSSVDVMSVSLAAMPRPLEFLSSWVEGAYLAPAGNYLPPPCLWLLPPCDPPATSFAAAAPVAAAGALTAVGAAGEGEEFSDEDGGRRRTSFPSGCYFAYDVVPAALHKSSFHSASLRRLALLLLHSGVARACRVAATPAAAASCCCCNRDGGGTDMQRQQQAVTFPLLLLGLQQDVFSRAADEDGNAATAVAAAAATGECTAAAAAFGGSPSSEDWNFAADTSALGAAQILRPIPRAALHWAAATGREHTAAVAVAAGSASAGSAVAGAAGAMGDAAVNSQVGLALLRLVEAAPPCVLLKEDVGDDFPHATDAAGYFVGEWQRQEKFLHVYEQQWELLICLQVLQLLASQPWGRAAVVAMVDAVWSSRYFFLERLLTLQYGEVPPLLRPLLLLQLAAVLQVCLVELQQAVAARRRRVTAVAAAFAEEELEEAPAASRDTSRSKAKGGGRDAAAAAEMRDIIRMAGRGKPRAAAAADPGVVAEKQLYTRRLRGPSNSNSRLMGVETAAKAAVAAEDNTAAAAPATAKRRGLISREAEERSRWRQEGKEEEEKISRLVKNVADMLLDSNRQGGNRDLLMCFLKLLLFFQNSVAAQPPLEQVVVSALNAAATADGGSASAGGKRGGKHKEEQRKETTAGFQVMQWLYQQLRLPSQIATLFAELACVEYRWGQAAAGGGFFFSSYPLVLFDPLSFLKLRDQLLSPLLQSSSSSPSSVSTNSSSRSSIPPPFSATAAGSLAVEKPCVLQWLAIRGRRRRSSSMSGVEISSSASAAAAAGDFRDIAFCGNVFSATLVSLWVYGFRQTSFSFTAAALRAVLQLIPSVLRCCFDLLSPCVTLLSPLLLQDPSLYLSSPCATGSFLSRSFFLPSSVPTAASSPAAVSHVDVLRFAAAEEADLLHRLGVSQRAIETLLPYLLPPLRLLLRRDGVSSEQQMKQEMLQQYQQCRLLEIVKTFYVCVETWCQDVAAVAAAVAAGVVAADLEAKVPRAFALQIASSTTDLLLFLETRYATAAALLNDAEAAAPVRGRAEGHAAAAAARGAEGDAAAGTASGEAGTFEQRTRQLWAKRMGGSQQQDFTDDENEAAADEENTLSPGASCISVPSADAAVHALLRLYLYTVLRRLFCLRCFSVSPAAVEESAQDGGKTSAATAAGGVAADAQQQQAAAAPSAVALGLLQLLKQDSSTATTSKGQQQLFHLLLLDAAKEQSLRRHSSFPSGRQSSRDDRRTSREADSFFSQGDTHLTAATPLVGTTSLVRFLKQRSRRQWPAAAAASFPVFCAASFFASDPRDSSFVFSPYPTVAAAVELAAAPVLLPVTAAAAGEAASAGAAAMEDELALAALLLLQHFFEATQPQQQSCFHSLLEEAAEEEAAAQWTSQQTPWSSAYDDMREGSAQARRSSNVFGGSFIRFSAAAIEGSQLAEAAARTAAAAGGTAAAAADRRAVGVLTLLAMTHLHGYSRTHRGVLTARQLQLAVATLSLLQTACNKTPSLIDAFFNAQAYTTANGSGGSQRYILLCLLLRAASPDSASLARAFMSVQPRLRRCVLQQQWGSRSSRLQQHEQEHCHAEETPVYESYPRLLDVLLTSPIFATSLGSAQLFRLVASPFYQQHPPLLPKPLRSARVSAVPFDLFFNITSLLQRLLRMRPLPGLLVDRVLQWTNACNSFLLVPVLLLSRLATAAAAAASSDSAARTLLQQEQQQDYYCSAGLLPSTLTEHVAVLNSLFRVSSRRSGRRRSSSSVAGWSGSGRVCSRRGSSGTMFMSEKIDQLHVAACMVLRLVRLLLARERDTKARMHYQLLRLQRSAAAAAFVAENILRLRSQFFYLDTLEEHLFLWLPLLLSDLPASCVASSSSCSASSSFLDSGISSSEEEDEEEYAAASALPAAAPHQEKEVGIMFRGNPLLLRTAARRRRAEPAKPSSSFLFSSFFVKGTSDPHHWSATGSHSSAAGRRRGIEEEMISRRCRRKGKWLKNETACWVRQLLPSTEALRWDAILLAVQVLGLALGECYGGEARQEQLLLALSARAPVLDDALHGLLLSGGFDALQLQQQALKVLALGLEILWRAGSLILPDETMHAAAVAAACTLRDSVYSDNVFPVFISTVEVVLVLLHHLLLLLLRPTYPRPSTLPASAATSAELAAKEAAVSPGKFPLESARLAGAASSYGQERRAAAASCNQWQKLREVAAMHPKLPYLPLLIQRLRSYCAAQAARMAAAATEEEAAAAAAPGGVSLAGVAFFAERLQELLLFYVQS